MSYRAMWAATLALTAAVVACDREEPGAVEAAAEPVAVSVSQPVRAPVTEAYAATVASTDEAELATRTSGTVLRVHVDVGSRVAAGDTLVELDAADVDARIESAEAARELARERFGRIRRLQRDGAATEQELDDARAALRRAEAGLREARAQQNYVVLRAPFAGTVARRDVDPGDLAVPGRPILALVRPMSIKIVADLPGAVGTRVRAGQRLGVRDPESGLAVPARVTRVSPARDRESRRVRVELRLVDGDGGERPALVPGAYVRLERDDPDATSVWMPADALVRRGQLEGVFVVRDSVLDLRWVRVGARRGAAVEVLAGVGAGDRVVRAPAPGLADGTPVASAETRPWSSAAGARGGTTPTGEGEDGSSKAGEPRP